jgi:multisite-specific tRNA:(cytosine-C5)-methyltransferase
MTEDQAQSLTQPKNVENKAFEEFYKQLFKDDAEYADFVLGMKTRTDVAFRFLTLKTSSSYIKDQMKSTILNQIRGDNLKSVGWTPDENAWVVNAFGMTNNDLVTFIADQAKKNAIIKCDLTSMIPALLLDVQPSHTVLDICSFSTSTTLYLLENLHRSTDEPTGLVISNLISCDTEALKKYTSPNLLGMYHQYVASFPSLVSPNGTTLEYDRILCTVPSSKDGTMMNDMKLWGNWNIEESIKLQSSQIEILDRAAQLEGLFMPRPLSAPLKMKLRLLQLSMLVTEV